MPTVRNRIAVIFLAAALSVGTLEAAAAPNAGPLLGEDPTAAAFKRGATVRLSSTEMEEGRRFTVTARIQSPRRATTLTWQRWDIPVYYGTPSWKPLRTVKVRGRRTIPLKRVARGRNTERYRVVVKYKKARKVTSKPAAAKVWHWVPLDDISSYYSTSLTGFSQRDVNGRSYRVWGPQYNVRASSWEMRFTPGRNCKEFRGLLGLVDSSDDGSSGAISFTIEDKDVYTSPTLVPGMTAPLTLKLARPYRFGLIATNTSADGLSAWPVVADPRLLCHGL